MRSRWLSVASIETIGLLGMGAQNRRGHLDFSHTELLSFGKTWKEREKKEILYNSIFDSTKTFPSTWLCISRVWVCISRVWVLGLTPSCLPREAVRNRQFGQRHGWGRGEMETIPNAALSPPARLNYSWINWHTGTKCFRAVLKQNSACVTVWASPRRIWQVLSQ